MMNNPRLILIRRTAVASLRCRAAATALTTSTSTSSCGGESTKRHICTTPTGRAVPTTLPLLHRHTTTTRTRWLSSSSNVATTTTSSSSSSTSSNDETTSKQQQQPPILTSIYLKACWTDNDLEEGDIVKAAFDLDDIKNSPAIVAIKLLADKLISAKVVSG